MTSRTKERPAPEPADWLSDQERDALRGAAETLSRALRVEVARSQLESLEKAERRRLRDLCVALRSTPEAPSPSPDEAANAAAFADGLSRLPAANKRVRRQQELLVEFVCELRFLPTPDERLVFRGVSADATFDDLRAKLAAVAPEWRGSRFNWAALGDGETEELERLVERAIKVPDFFADRRGEARSSAVTRMLLRHAEDATARRSLLRDGWASLSPELLADVHLGEIRPVDVAVLGVIAMTLMGREIHPACERHVRFDEDGALLIGDRGRRLLPTWDPEAEGYLPITFTFPAIIERLSRRGWLEASTSGNVLRVRLGDRLMAGEGP